MKLKCIKFKIIILILFLFGSALVFAQEKRNPFVSIIDRIEYEELQKIIMEKQSIENKKRQREESKKMGEELQRREQERQRVFSTGGPIAEQPQGQEAQMMPPVSGSLPDLPSFDFQGIVWSEKDPRVIINGQVYKVGDTFKEMQVVSINETGIGLLYRGVLYTKDISSKSASQQFNIITEDKKNQETNQDTSEKQEEKPIVLKI